MQVSKSRFLQSPPPAIDQNLIRNLIDRGNYHEALTEIEQMQRKDPEVQNLYYYRAICLIQLGSNREGMKSLIRELSCNPTNQQAATLLKTHKYDFIEAMTNAPFEVLQLASQVLRRLSNATLNGNSIDQTARESRPGEPSANGTPALSPAIRIHRDNINQKLDIYRYATDRLSEKCLSFGRKLSMGDYMVEAYPCPICENNEKWHFVVESDKGFRWSICESCGLFQQNHRLTEESLREYYESGEYSEINMSGITGERAFTLEYGSSARYIEILRRLEYDFSQLRVVDIGCGYGGILLALKELGAFVKGYDLNPASICYGRSRIREIEVGNALELDHDMSEYNLVLLTNVLEHLFNPTEFLLRLCERIGDRSVRVLIDVPNLEGVHEYSHNAANSHLLEFLNVGHLWYFTSISLERLLNKTGFKVDYIDNRGASMTVLCTKAKERIPNINNSLILSLSSINDANYKSWQEGVEIP